MTLNFREYLRRESGIERRSATPLTDPPSLLHLAGLLREIRALARVSHAPEPDEITVALYVLVGRTLAGVIEG